LLKIAFFIFWKPISTPNKNFYVAFHQNQFSKVQTRHVFIFSLCLDFQRVPYIMGLRYPNYTFREANLKKHPHPIRFKHFSSKNIRT
jgi:hypothetical protein